MSDFNNVTLVGRLGKDPEVFRHGSKPPFATIQLATNKSWKKDGQKYSKTEWHTVIFNRKLAELAEKHLRKGEQVLVSGELASQKWLDKDGNKKTSTYVQAKELRFLTKKAQESEPDVTVDTDVCSEEENFPVF